MFSFIQSKYYFLLFWVLISGCSNDNVTNINAHLKRPTPALGELSKAVVRSNKGKVIELLDQGANVNENVGTDSEPITPLILAIGTKLDSLAIILLERGADPAQRAYGYQLLEFAHFKDDGHTPEKLFVLLQDPTARARGTTRTSTSNH